MPGWAWLLVGVAAVVAVLIIAYLVWIVRIATDDWHGT